MELIPLVVLLLAALLTARSVSHMLRAAWSAESATLLTDDAASSRLLDLLSRKDLLLKAIQSTHLDFDTSKISADDRDRTIRRLESEAVEVLRAVDELRGTDVDIARARTLVESEVSAAIGETDAVAWSAAARLRHNGKAPGAGLAALLLLALLHNPEPALAQEPDPHAGHDHAGHDHAGHDHAGHDHAGHDHGDPAASPEGSGESSAAEGSSPVVTADAPVADIRVRVLQTGPDGTTSGLAGEPVRLHVVLPPHELVETREGVTDASGEYVFRVAIQPGLEVAAEVQTDVPPAPPSPPMGPMAQQEPPDTGRRFSEPIRLQEPGEYSAEITLFGITSDPSHVFVSRMVTVLQPTENFIMVQQVFHFGVDIQATWSPVDGDDSTLIRVTLPDDADGVRIMVPGPQLARHADDQILFAAPVSPAGSGSRRPDLIVSYSIKHHNSRDWTFSQPLSIDVTNASFVVPQTTEFSRHRHLPITLQTALCDNPTDGKLCFAEITDRVEGTGLNPDLQVLVARGGAGDVGDVLEVHTSGWPSALPIRQWAAALAIVLGVLLALAVGKGMKSGGQATAAQVALAQQHALLAQAQQVRDALARGEMLRTEHDGHMARIEEQLAAVMRRAREQQPLASATAPSAQTGVQTGAGAPTEAPVAGDTALPGDEPPDPAA
jgi:hypothetical protein